MNAQPRSLQDSPSLLSVLVGLYPLIIFGPCAVLLTYPFPPPAWRLEPVVTAIQLAGMGLPILVGFAVGWLRRFPLWSYPYITLVTGYLLAIILSIPSLLNWRGEYLSVGISALAILLEMAVLVLITRRDLPIARLWQDIRTDWTRLSLGLLVVPNFFFSSIDHEEDPVLTVFVIGPCLVIVLTALLYFMVQRKSVRSIILVAGMVLAILIRLPSGKWFYIYYWLVTAIIVFLPATINLLQQKAKPNQEPIP